MKAQQRRVHTEYRTFFSFPVDCIDAMFLIRTKPNARNETRKDDQLPANITQIQNSISTESEEQ